MSEHLCVVCKRRGYLQAMVCDPCRAHLASQIAEVADRFEVLPAALASRPYDVMDLTYPARGGASAVTVHDPMHDQRGEIPVAAKLDSWARDWITTLPNMGDHLPVPTVYQLTQWLTNRLKDACDSHLAIDEFATEIRQLLASIRRAINLDLTPVRYKAACPYCETRTLRRDAGADWIECRGSTREEPGCGRLWTQDEYGLLARAAIHEDELLDTGEAALLANVEPRLIRLWAHRGHLIAERDGQGKPWYRKREVEDVAARLVKVAVAGS